MPKRVLKGTVVSNKNQKTIVVEVNRKYMHPLYHKIVQASKRYMAHDENDTCKVGEEVKIIESRPISKNKKWALLEKLDGNTWYPVKA